jgi:hypothetical protein
MMIKLIKFSNFFFWEQIKELLPYGYLPLQLEWFSYGIFYFFEVKASNAF